MDIALHLKPRVPVEVAESIIDLLADDHHAHPSLRNCAVVCQAWLPRSRTHLFRTVRIVDLKRLTSLYRTLVSDPKLGQLVQCVDLEGSPSRRPSQVTSSDTFYSAPPVLLALLPNLRSWIFRGSTNDLSILESKPIALACLPRYSGINHLSLVDIWFQHTTDLFRLLLALPALHSLEVREIFLVKKGVYFDRLVTRLSTRQLRLSVLQLYKVTLCYDADRSLLLTLAKAVAPHLNYLTVDRTELIKIGSSQIAPSLATYRSLVTLTLMAATGLGSWYNHDLGMISRIIEFELPPTVVTVNIDLTQWTSLEMSKYLSNPDPGFVATRTLKWEKLDQAMTVAQDRHPCLREFRIILPQASQRHTDRWSLVVGASLPKSMARSLCHVVSNVEQTTFRWSYQHADEKIVMLVADPAGKVIVSRSSDRIYFWDIEHEGLLERDKVGEITGLLYHTSHDDGPYFDVSMQAGSPWTSVGIVDQDVDDYPSLPVSWRHLNNHEIQSHIFCGSPPRIVYNSFDGAMHAIFIRDIRYSNIRVLTSIPAQVHRPSSRLRPGSFAVSADKRWLADWHTPGMVLVWNVVPDAPTLYSRFTFPSFSARSSEHSPSPEFLLAATFDHESEDTGHGLCHLVGVSNRGAVWRWDVETGAPVRHPWRLSPPHAAELSSDTSESSIAFSRSGRRLAWICPDQGLPGSSRGLSTVRVIDLSGFQRTGGRRTQSVVLEGHDGAVNAFALAPSGDYVATASADGTARLWRTDNGECVRTFTEHEAAVTHVVISADGRILASGAANGTVCVRKMEEILSKTEESEE